jgi:hypothetical protein
MPILIIAEDVDDDERTGARIVLRALERSRCVSWPRTRALRARSWSTTCARPRRALA